MADKQPAVALTYGLSGIGKTLDAGYSFPRGLFLAAPGACKPIPAMCGYTPKVINTVKTIDDATKIIEQAAKMNGHDAVIIDDFSFLAEQTMQVLERRHHGFKLFGALRDSVLRFRAAARYAGTHILITCWERGPKMYDDGIRQRGGPMLSGKLPEQLPAMCDLVLRAEWDSMRKPWGGIYRVDGGADWVGKDRDSGTPSPAPLNIGEILRLNGYTVARHPELDWQEEMVEKIAGFLTASGPERDRDLVAQAYSQLVGQGKDPRHARWTLRDAWDRATLRRAKAAYNSTFF